MWQKSIQLLFQAETPECHISVYIMMHWSLNVAFSADVICFLMFFILAID